MMWMNRRVAHQTSLIPTILLAVACSLCPGGVQGAASPGRCEPYVGEICNGTVFYNTYSPGVNEGDEGFLTMEEKNRIILAYFDVAQPRITAQQCKVYFTQFVCAFWYPPCKEVAPGYIISLPPCENTCSDLYTKCNDILMAAAAAQASGFTILPVPILGESGKCDQDFFGGDTPFVQAAAEDNWVTKYPYEPGYEGERVFPEESATYTLDGEEHEMKCFDFSNFKVSCEDSRGETTCGSYQKKNPYTADIHECIGEQCEDSAHIDSCNAKVCPSHMVSHSGLPSCSRDCWEICPSNRKYEESEYSTMFLVYVIPGLLAIPMNMYISVGFAVGRKTVHKKARPYLKVAGYLMLLWGIFHIVPSAVMSTEMVCNDGTTESSGAKGICTFHRGTIHLLQSAYYWMTAAIIDLYMSIVLEYADRKRKQRSKGVMIFATVVPFAMMCWTYGMQVNDSESLLAVFDGVGGVDYPNRVWNSSKDFFTCSPRLRYFWEEIVTVHIHFIIGACVMIPCLSHIVIKLLSSAFKTSGKQESFNGKVQSILKKSGAKKLIVMGTLVTFLLVLQLIAIANIFPKMKEFAEKDEQFDSCKYGMVAKYGGEPCLDDGSCCDYTDPTKLGAAPGSLLLAFGYFFPLSCISLVYAVVCVGDKGHATVWRGMLGLKAAKTTPTGNSSVSSTY